RRARLRDGLDRLWINVPHRFDIADSGLNGLAVPLHALLSSVEVADTSGRPMLAGEFLRTRKAPRRSLMKGWNQAGSQYDNVIVHFAPSLRPCQSVRRSFDTRPRRVTTYVDGAKPKRSNGG